MLQGVAVKADCKKLARFLRIDSRGLFELSRLHNLVKFSENPKKVNHALVSLAQQVQEHLELPLEKGEVRTGDWSQDLDYQQTQCKAPCLFIILDYLTGPFLRCCFRFVRCCSTLSRSGSEEKSVRAYTSKTCACRI